MRNNLPLSLIGILILTTICFFPVLNAEFSNWDDTTHLLNNSQVRSLNFLNIKNIFTSTVSQVYIPLTVLSFAIEYHFFQYQPFIYHLNNLILHLLVVALLFLFLKKIKAPKTIVILSTLIFAIHPIHVESVAWVTERKDVLYSVFYLLALLSYVKFLEKRNIWFYFLTLLLGWLSISAKVMAISLPLVLLLLDWFFDQKRGVIRPLLEKIPFAIYCLPLAYLTQSINPGTVSLHADLGSALLIFIWTFSFYIAKFFFPYPLIPLYKTPEPISLTNPVYTVSLIIFVGFFIFITKFRKDRWIIFSVMFYITSIFFLFRFDKLTNLSVVADRFIYLPSAGLCLLTGIILNKIILKTGEKQKLGIQFGTCILIILSILTFKQSQIWQNSFTLWDHQIKYEPDTVIAYNNRGSYLHEQNKQELALKDYNHAIEIDPTHAQAYNNRGTLYAEQGKNELAKQDYLNAIILYSIPYAEAYHNLGTLFLDSKKYDAAVANIDQALAINPNFDNAYNTKGTYFVEMNQPQLAINEFNKALAVNPGNAVSLNNRGVIFGKFGQHEQALNDFDQSILIDPNYIDPYVNKGLVYKQKGDLDMALNLLNQAIQLDPYSTNALNNRGLIYVKQQKFEEALEDFNTIVKTDDQFVDAFISRGTILGSQKKFDEAIVNYTEGIKLAPEKLVLFINRGAVHLMTNDTQKALQDFNHVINKDPQESVAYYYRSLCFKRLRDYSKAVNDALAAKDLGYPNIDVYLQELSTLSTHTQ